jgi:hypothetical protein
MRKGTQNILTIGMNPKIVHNGILRPLSLAKAKATNPKIKETNRMGIKIIALRRLTFS